MECAARARARKFFAFGETNISWKEQYESLRNSTTEASK
jgi:hypothetical protein